VPTLCCEDPAHSSRRAATAPAAGNTWLRSRNGL
jgi:hypothetical protein